LVTKARVSTIPITATVRSGSKIRLIDHRGYHSTAAVIALLQRANDPAAHRKVRRTPSGVASGANHQAE
jgi:hypothetical protein